jgi:hypothetical protein
MMMNRYFTYNRIEIPGIDLIKYPGKISFRLKIIIRYEPEDQMGSFDEKKKKTRIWKSHAWAPLGA